MCSINTRICIQYMASCNLCHLWGRITDMYNFGSCSVRANGRDRKLDGGFVNSDHKPRSIYLDRLNMTLAELQYRSEPEGFGWFQSVDDSTRECFYLNAKSTALHSWCLLWIFIFSSEFLYADFLVLLILLAFLGSTSAPDYKSFGDPTSG